MKRFQFLLLLFLLASVPSARAAETISASTMEAYYAMADSLVRDSLEHVAENAKKFAAGVQDPVLQISATNVASATQVGLGRTRDMFRFLSQVFANGIKQGEFHLAQGPAYRVHCPMKDADWLQPAESPIRNPYHGSEMTDCGGVVAKFEAK